MQCNAGLPYEYFGCYKNADTDVRLNGHSKDKSWSWCEDASKKDGKTFFGME